MFGRGLKKNIAGLVIMTMVLGGCGNTSSDGNTSQEMNENAESQAVVKEDEVIQSAIEDLEPGEKYQITLGCIPTIMPQLLEAAIVDFNKSNPYYEVVVKEYDWQEGQQRLEMDLATGRGPDIFDLSMVYVDTMVEKGMLEDLTSYLTDGQGIEREDLVESVLKCNTKEGVLTCIPPRFTLEVMVGKKSLIGENSDWTVEEFLECVKTNEGMQVAKSNYRLFRSELLNRYSIVHTAIYRGMDYFVDVMAKEARFDQKEFVELLTYAKNYEAEAFDYETQSDFTYLVQEETLLLELSGINTVRNYLLINATLGSETQFVGFPTYDGGSGYGIRNYISYGINADSQVKDGAWAFLEFLITYRLASSFMDEYGFHTNEALLKEQFAEAMTKEYTTNDKGEKEEIPKWIDSQGVNVYAATEEDIDRLRTLIDNPAYVFGLDSNSIYQIVEEEVYNCLGGTQSVEETVSLIQNRVQLYLDEMN